MSRRCAARAGASNSARASAGGRTRGVRSITASPPSRCRGARDGPRACRSRLSTFSESGDGRAGGRKEERHARRCRERRARGARRGHARARGGGARRGGVCAPLPQRLGGARVPHCGAAADRARAARQPQRLPAGGRDRGATARHRAVPARLPADRVVARARGAAGGRDRPRARPRGGDAGRLGGVRAAARGRRHPRGQCRRDALQARSRRGSGGGLHGAAARHRERSRAVDREPLARRARNLLPQAPPPRERAAHSARHARDAARRGGAAGGGRHVGAGRAGRGREPRVRGARAGVVRRWHVRGGRGEFGRRGGAAGGGDGAVSDARVPQLWICDADPANARWLEALFAFESIETRRFEEADALLEALGLQVPDVLLIDLLLPGVSGLSVLERLREEGRAAARLPVVVTSAARLAPHERARIRGLGAAIAAKPLQPDEVLRRVRYALARASAPAREEEVL
ncbi:MAG: response regulator [Planctomycetota bacterium]|nr:MAG: response regulator [Planctomycetota bacterium]